MTTLNAEADRAPVGAHELVVLDATGDVRHMWDAERPNEVDIARQVFDDGRAKGMVAYRVTEGGDRGEVMNTFDPTAQKIIMAPALRGG